MNRYDAKQDGAGLYWLAFLLTGRHDVSIEVAADAAVVRGEGNPFFENWMKAWARRVAVAKALAEIRPELADSARRTRLARTRRWSAPRNWSLPPDASKPELEEALLAIDVFPRAALLLSIFERVPV